MSKRVRGTPRPHRRPGTRLASERPVGIRRRSDEESPSQLEAAALVAEDVVENEPVEAAAELRRVERAHPRHRTKPGSLLAARAATEYVYVAQDMRRIALVAALLLVTLIVLWLLIVVLRVIPLDFY